MIKTLVVFWLVSITGLAYADVFNIEGKKINIPAPQGFSIVTQQMDAVYRMSIKINDPGNDQLAYYISDSEIQTAMEGKLPTLERYFILKVNKELKNMIIGTKEFEELKKKISL